MIASTLNIYERTVKMAREHFKYKLAESFMKFHLTSCYGLFWTSVQSDRQADTF